MGNRFSLALIGLVLVCTSQAWAGSSGNGWGQRNGIAPVAVAHYSYCFGGRPSKVYFSGVITSAPTVYKPQLGGPFGKYLTQTYGFASNDGGQCVTSEVMADVVRAKQQREAEFVARTWTIVETDWVGGE